MPRKIVYGIVAERLVDTFSAEDHDLITNVLMKVFAIENPESIEITPITTGYSLTARNFILTINNKKYVFRLTDLKRDIVSRQNEISAHEQLGKLKVTPKVYYANVEEGVIISDFINEVTPKWTGSFDKSMASSLALKVRSLHSTPNENILLNEEISASGLPNDSRQRVGEILNREPAFYLQRFTLALLTDLEKMMSKNCQVHHDLHGGNILFDGEEFWFIDLEHTGFGDKYVDLAVICLITSFQKGMEEHFLTAYFGRDLTVEEKNKMVLAKVICCLRYAISSFSNCEDYKLIAKEPVLGIVKFTGYSSEIDGELDVESDLGKHWQCISLIKQGLDSITHPDFGGVLQTSGSDKSIFNFEVSLNHQIQSEWLQNVNIVNRDKLTSIENLLLEKPEWLDTIEKTTLLGLSRLLRTIANVEIDVENTRGNVSFEDYSALKLWAEKEKIEVLIRLTDCYGEIESIVHAHSKRVFSHNSLALSQLLYKKDGRIEEFWVSDWKNAGYGVELMDLAECVQIFNLSPQNEDFVLISYFGSRISAQTIAYYQLVKFLIRLRRVVSDVHKKESGFLSGSPEVINAVNAILKYKESKVISEAMNLLALNKV